jgi:hypothetical protein
MPVLMLEIYIQMFPELCQFEAIPVIQCGEQVDMFIWSLN